MPMTQQGRAAAIYDQIVRTNATMAELSADEQSKMRQSIQSIFGADLAYVQQNATVVVAPSVQVAPGQSVSAPPPSGQGSTTSPGSLTGTGTLQ